jgi:transposase
LGIFFQKILSRIPNIVSPQITPNKLQPQTPRKGIRHTGVYVAAIRTWIIAWSRVCNLLTYLGARGSQWYIALAVYKRNIPAPNTEKAAICQGLKGSRDSWSNKLNAKIARTAPIAWDIALNGSLIFITIYLSIIVAIPWPVPMHMVARPL